MAWGPPNALLASEERTVLLGTLPHTLWEPEAPPGLSCFSGGSKGSRTHMKDERLGTQTAHGILRRHLLTMPNSSRHLFFLPSYQDPLKTMYPEP